MTTRPQREAIHRLYQRWYGPNSPRADQHITYLAFRRKVFTRRTLDPYASVVLPLDKPVGEGGMFVGIEPDGYTHT